MAEQTVKQQIQEIREFFATITSGTPKTIEALDRLNQAFNAILGGGNRFKVSADSIVNDFIDITKASTATAAEISKVSSSMEGLIGKINKLPTSKLKITGSLAESYKSGNIKPDALLKMVQNAELGRYRPEELMNRLRNLSTGAFLPSGGVGRPEGVRLMEENLFNAAKKGQQIPVEKLSSVFTSTGAFSSSLLTQSAAINKVIPALSLLINEYKNLDVSGEAAKQAQAALNAQLETFRHIISQPGGFEKLQAGMRNINLLNAPAGAKLTMADYFDKTFGTGGSSIYKKVEAFAKRYGYQMENIKSITREASTGLARISFHKTTSIVDNDDIKMTEKMGVSIDKLGNVARDTQRRFQTFASGIARDTGEFLKWSIAASLVYAPLQQLNKLMTEMTENQSKLADLQIITNQSSKEVYDSFGNIADVASITGQSLGDTIDAYKAAYVAAGSIADENQRAATATVLLSDSLLLTRLSTLTQAESLDILASALKQVGGQLTDTDNKLLSGVDLINKWVAVSKVANVSVDTLARSFSIVGSAAEDVGLGIDELNGVIAAVAEVSSLSPTETGNMVRAFISGYQSDEAIKELGRFGIAVTDSEGKVREYMTVMEEIKSLTDAGIVSPEQAAKIADTLGGGARRGAQYASFLDNLNKVQQIANISATAQSLAYDALGIKMDTLKGSTQKLGVAFSTLAQSLGQEGGMLQTATDLVNVLTFITKGITSLSGALGTALPMLVTFGTAMAFFSANTAAADKGIALLSRIGYGLGSGVAKKLKIGSKDLVGDVASTTYMNQPNVQAQMRDAGLPAIILSGTEKGADAWGSKLSQTLVNNLPKIIAAAAAVGPVIANAREGQWGGAAADVGGAVGGYALGSAAFGKFSAMAGPIGAMIGISIAESFVNTVSKDINLSKGLAETYARILKDSLPKTSEEAKANEAQTALREAEKALKTFEPKGTKGLVNLLAPAFAKGGIADTGQEMTLEESALALYMFYAEKGGEAGKKAIKAYWDAFWATENSEMDTDDEAVNKIVTNMSKQIMEAEAKFGKLDLGIQTEAKGRAIEQVQFGEISGTDFKTQMTTLQTLPILTKQLWAAGGAEFQKNAKDIKTADEAYKELSETLLGMTEQEKSLVIQMAGEIAVLQGNTEKVDERIAKEKELGLILASARSGQAIQQISIPQIADFGKTSYQSTVNTLMKAQKETREYYDQFIDDPVALEKFLADLDEVSARYWKEAGELSAYAYTEGFSGIDQEILSKVMETAKKAGEIAIKPQDISIRDFTDMTMAEFQGGLLPNIQAWSQFLAKATGEERELEPMLVVLKDGATMQHLDAMAMQLAQQKTNELLQDQLDGIYNLPEGMQLWVPSQAAEMSAKTLAGGGGGFGGYIGPPPLPNEGLPVAGNVVSSPITEQIATKATDAAIAMAETKMLRAEEPRIPEREPLIGMDFWKELLGLNEITTNPRERDEFESPLINNLYKATTPGMIPDPITLWSPLTNALTDAWDSILTGFQPVLDAFKSDNTKPVTRNDITLNSTHNINIDGMRLATIVKRMIARDLASYGGNRSISAFMT